MRSRLSIGVALTAALLVSTGCSINALGGREECWPEGDPRAASLWRGTLRIDAAGGRLETLEGDIIPLIPGAIEIRGGPDGNGELVRGSDVVSRAGDYVTLFGGAGGDGSLVVCAVEEIHSTAS
jgi:hypothetical protein